MRIIVVHCWPVDVVINITIESKFERAPVSTRNNTEIIWMGWAVCVCVGRLWFASWQFVCKAYGERERDKERDSDRERKQCAACVRLKHAGGWRTDWINKGKHDCELTHQRGLRVSYLIWGDDSLLSKHNTITWFSINKWMCCSVTLHCCELWMAFVRI